MYIDRGEWQKLQCPRTITVAVPMLRWFLTGSHQRMLSTHLKILWGASISYVDHLVYISVMTSSFCVFSLWLFLVCVLRFFYWTLRLSGFNLLLQHICDVILNIFQTADNVIVRVLLARWVWTDGIKIAKSMRKYPWTKLCSKSDRNNL